MKQGLTVGKFKGKWASSKIVWHKKLWRNVRIFPHEDNGELFFLSFFFYFFEYMIIFFES